jgi:hypothetical protein
MHWLGEVLVWLTDTQQAISKLLRTRQYDVLVAANRSPQTPDTAPLVSTSADMTADTARPRRRPRPPLNGTPPA